MKRIEFLILGAILSGPAHLAGQEAVVTVCPDGVRPRGDAGISSFECNNCALRTEGDRRVWSFSSEPRVLVVEPGSPADAKIEGGDAIVAIDGHLITTVEGGRRLANLPPGKAVSLVLRRGDRERTVEIVPRGECPTPSPTAAPPPELEGVSEGAPPAAPVTALAPVPEAAPAYGVAVGPVPRPTYALLPAGWFGFGIRCTECRWSVTEEDGTSEWEFTEAPEINSVEPGSPAEAAGLRRGDVLLEIDGVSLVSPAGGRRFGSVEPGETVRWTFRRGDRTRTAAATAAERPGVPPPSPAPPAAAAYARGLARAYEGPDVGRLRYSGLIGETSVEVRGAGSVVVNIIEPGREIEIVTSDSRTLIRVEEPR